MAAYWVARCHVTNQEEYSKYAELAGPVIESYGGKFLARGGEQVEVEGGTYERTVLVEFETFEKAVAAYESEDYQKALKALDNGADREIRIFAGV